MKYLPFMTGSHSTASGLIPMSKKAVVKYTQVFHIDDHYTSYISNKENCRAENIYKYYLELQLKNETLKKVLQFIIAQLKKEYPDKFTFSKNDSSASIINKLTGENIEWNQSYKLINNNKYLTLFDALCSQLQENQ